MLKKRIIACLVVRDGMVVQSIGFRHYLPVGTIRVSVEFLNSWGVDEIVLVDITAGRRGQGPNLPMAAEASKKCFVPLAVGGGIRSVEDVRHLIHSGADKVVINRSAVTRPQLISEAAEVFGCQCIVVSIDAKRTSSGAYEVFVDSGATPTGLDPVSHARRVAELGAGEIFINSMDRDGSKQGYDLDLVRRVSNEISIPVIVCGGVGHPEHFGEGLRAGNVSAVAAANFFHFSEHSVITSKAYLRKSQAEVRLDTYANYRDHAFDDKGRIDKQADEILANRFFEFYPKEVI